MAITDRLTAKARQRMEQQLTAGERLLLSGTVGPVGLVLTDQRLMLVPPVNGAFPDRSLPLGAIQDVAWKKGLLGSQGMLTIRTGSETLEYKVPNKQGEPAATRIRQAMAGE